MNAKISEQIQAEQDHGRAKWQSGNIEGDDLNTPGDWAFCIRDHNARAATATPMERRQELIKVAGLAVSAVEAIDRAIERGEPIA